MKAIVFLLAVALVVGAAGSASAQTSRIYFGGVVGSNGGSRGPVDVDTVRTAGGVFGIRLTGAWSVEIEADRGLSTTRRDDGETVWISYAPIGSTPAEIERLGVRARFVRIDESGPGYSVLAVWKSREPGRVNVALSGGISQRSFDKRVIRTITHVPENAGIPSNDPNVRDADETRTITGGGLTGSVMVPVRLTRALAVAPDFRVTLGLITDESTYKVFSAGVRLMWGF